MTTPSHTPSRNHSYSIDAYTSSPHGVRFSANERLDAARQLYALRTDDRDFAYERYAQEIHQPVPLPHLDTAPLREEYPRCLDMPIRLAGDEEYAVPQEWEGLLPLIEQIVATEQVNNPNWRDRFTYMTLAIML